MGLLISMRFFRILILILVLFGNIHAATENSMLAINESIVKFVSEAPLERIEASSKTLKGQIDTARRIFGFQIKMSSFQGFNSYLQKEHFEENYLEIMKYPNATYTGKIIGNVNFNKDGDYEVRGKGAFSIHGVEMERIIKCVVNVKKGIYTITSEFPVNLAEHNIRIPKLVKEKISNDINVSIKIVMK